jgi:hypothetical protein
LSSDQCSQYNSKKSSCKKNGCIFNKNTANCIGRWDDEISLLR